MIKIFYNDLKKKPDTTETLPEAMGLVRKFLIENPYPDSAQCDLEYDGLVIVISLKPGWDIRKLP